MPAPASAPGSIRSPPPPISLAPAVASSNNVRSRTHATESAPTPAKRLHTQTRENVEKAALTANDFTASFVGTQKGRKLSETARGFGGSRENI